jgi:hypothetical protein
MRLRDRGQQEIVGFVLIVVLVMIALMVFLIISVRDDGGEEESVEVSNMLDVLMKATTECAIVYEPDYDNIEELFKSCYKGDSCNNLGVPACEYLNESLLGLVSSMVASDASFSGWEVDFFVRDDAGILRWGDVSGCNGSTSGAQRSIVSGGSSLVVTMRICGI